MKILPAIYLRFTEPGGVPTADQFTGVFRQAQLRDADFVKDIYIPGSGGESRLVEQFSRELGLEARTS